MLTQEQRLSTPWYAYLLDSLVTKSLEEVLGTLRSGSVASHHYGDDVQGLLNAMLVPTKSEEASVYTGAHLDAVVDYVSRHRLAEIFRRDPVAPVLGNKPKMADIAAAITPDLEEHVKGFPVRITTGLHSVLEAIKYRTRGLSRGALAVTQPDVLISDLKARGEPIALPQAIHKHTWGNKISAPAAYHVWLYPERYVRKSGYVSHRGQEYYLEYAGSTTGVEDTATVLASLLETGRTSADAVTMALLGHTTQDVPADAGINADIIQIILRKGPDNIIAVANALKETLANYEGTALSTIVEGLKKHDSGSTHGRRYSLLAMKLLAEYPAEFMILSAPYVDTPEYQKDLQWFGIARDFALQHGKEKTLELVDILKEKLKNFLPSAEDYSI